MKPGRPINYSRRSGVFAGRGGQFAGVRYPGLVRGFRFLLEHCYEPVNICDVVNASGISRRGFHYVFFKCLGVQPGQFLRDLRIQRAKQLLAGSDLKQETVALMSGYERVNSFWVAFRKATGLSPEQFRKRVHCGSRVQPVEPTRWISTAVLPALEPGSNRTNVNCFGGIM